MRFAARASIFVALLATVFPSAPAAAQAPPPPTAPVIVPPKPIGVPHADYPKGAHGSGSVVLELMIEADGSVRSARAVAGIEPFVSAAIAAAAGFRFEPATRNGVAKAAAMRVEILF